MEGTQPTYNDVLQQYWNVKNKFESEMGDYPSGFDRMYWRVHGPKILTENDIEKGVNENTQALGIANLQEGIADMQVGINKLKRCRRIEKNACITATLLVAALIIVAVANR